MKEIFFVSVFILFVSWVSMWTVSGCAPVEVVKKTYEESERKPSVNRTLIEGHQYIHIGVGVEHDPDCFLNPETKCFKRK